MTTFEVMMEQRKYNMRQAQQRLIAAGIVNNTVQNPKANQNQLPPELYRTYQLVIVNGESDKKTITKLREVRAQQIGQLVTIRGIVTRASDVKPCIMVAVSACDICGWEVYAVVNAKEFNPIVECPSDKCRKNNIKGQLQIQVKSSKFVSFQEIKIQEPSDQVPIGHVPRTLKVLARDQLTRKCAPGDIVTLTGVYLPQPYYGFNKGGLFQDTYLEAF